MKRFRPILIASTFFLGHLWLGITPSEAFWNSNHESVYITEEDSTTEVGSKLKKDRLGDKFSNKESVSPIQLTPSNIKTDIKINKGLRDYTVEEKIGDLNYRAPSIMTFQEYAEYQRTQMMRNYWKNNARAKAGQEAENDISPPVFQKKNAAGQNIIEVRPSGFVNLDFGGRWQRVDNPAIAVQQQRVGGFEFDQQIQMNVVGIIGDRLKLTANWDTKAIFDFDNNIKIEYHGKEEDIIQDIEAGNVSMPIKNTLVRGAQNLFGIRADLRFGKLDVTALVSNQRGKTKTLTIKGGGQQQSVKVEASGYDDYRHFFLAPYFRNNYNGAFTRNPQFPNFGAKINRIEVYVTNRNNTVDNVRNFVSLVDLGDGNLPRPTTLLPSDNENGSLFNDIINLAGVRNADNTITTLTGSGLVNGTDFEVVRSARKLEEGRDFTYHPDLGYISLTSRIGEDEAIGVAFEYSVNGVTHQVGELSNDYANLEQNDVIILKMIKPQSVKTRPFPTWDLMMKNIYQVASGSFSEKNFQLKVVYEDDATGLDNPVLQDEPSLSGKNLVNVLGADKFNNNGDFSSDGNWDYLNGTTVEPKRGRVIFPVLEPFGATLESKVANDDKYVFNTLYASTKNDAINDKEKDKFFLVGRVQTASGNGTDIRLSGINIAENSVVVLVGGISLTEGTDYTVNYQLGRVKILNQGVLSSGKDIKITYEESDLFNFRTKSLVGARFDYHVKKNFDIGATVLHLSERPVLRRVNIGDEPVKNTQIGLDVHYQDDSRLITKLVDKLPGISTKKPSNVKIDWEGAVFKPGNSKFIGDDGNAYIDDFEGAEIPFDLGRSPIRWALGATPKSVVSDSNTTGLGIGYRRAKLSWYNVDQSFYFGSGNNTLELSDIDKENFYSGSYNVSGINGLFPGLEQNNGQNTILSTFDLAFYPSERGPYNYNPLTAPEIDAATGNFTAGTEEDNWGAVTRAITFDTDFDNANIEFIEFWLLDPFIEGTDGLTTNTSTSKGDLYFQLGNISEDVLQDNRHSFENGLPDNTTSSDWGEITTQQFLNNAFDNTKDRNTQDVGLDGLNNTEEFNFFKDTLGGTLPSNLANDPSSDDFIHYNDPSVANATLLEKYKNFYGLEGNASLETTDNGFSLASKTIPDNEDLNNDNTLGTVEEYFQYKVPLSPGDLDVSTNPFITDVREVLLNSSATSKTAKWYQFRIPIRQPNDTVGSITGFKSIKYIRTLLHGFENPVVLRMANFQLVSSQWRRFQDSIVTTGTCTPTNNATFNFSTVNSNENAASSSGANVSNYISPIQQDVDVSSGQALNVNEQALKLTATGLSDGETKAVFKNLAVDLLNYETVKMFIHAETDNLPASDDSEVNAIIRLG
ncbi:MAG: cell surface protein SprA, partial [Cyclobacteriaceae bacterium]